MTVTTTPPPQFTVDALVKPSNGLSDESVTIVLGGRRFQARLCWLGLQNAEDLHGYDVSTFGLSEDEVGERKGNLRQMLELVWFAILAYHPEVGLEDLARMVRLDDFAAVTEAYGELVGRFAPKDTEDDGGEKKS